MEVGQTVDRQCDPSGPSESSVTGAWNIPNASPVTTSPAAAATSRSRPTSWRRWSRARLSTAWMASVRRCNAAADRSRWRSPVSGSAPMIWPISSSDRPAERVDESASRSASARVRGSGSRWLDLPGAAPAVLGRRRSEAPWGRAASATRTGRPSSGRPGPPGHLGSLDGRSRSWPHRAVCPRGEVNPSQLGFRPPGVRAGTDRSQASDLPEQSCIGITAPARARGAAP